MGNGVISRIRDFAGGHHGKIEEITELPATLTQRPSAGNMRRMSFYQKKKITDENMDLLRGRRV